MAGINDDSNALDLFRFILCYGLFAFGLPLAAVMSLSLTAMEGPTLGVSTLIAIQLVCALSGMIFGFLVWRTRRSMMLATRKQRVQLKVVAIVTLCFLLPLIALNSVAIIAVCYIRISGLSRTELESDLLSQLQLKDISLADIGGRHYVGVCHLADGEKCTIEVTQSYRYYSYRVATDTGTLRHSGAKRW
jgi:hypothetical protein